MRRGGGIEEGAEGGGTHRVDDSGNHDLVADSFHKYLDVSL